MSTKTQTFWSALALCAALLAPSAAQAGDLKFGAEPLAVNAAGKITDEGKKAATQEIKSAEGEETWQIHVYAQIDKGGPGPLYVEFFGKLPDGKPYLTYRHEHGGYSGGKYVSLDFEVTGNLGFNKNKTYNVKVLQVSPKGKDIVFATGKLTLSYTEPPAEEPGEEDGGDDETEGGEDEGAAQDAADSLDGGAADGPPPVEPNKKKGCSVHPEAPGFGLTCLLLAAGVLRRRRR